MRLSTLLILIISCFSLSCKTIYKNTSIPSINTDTIKTTTNLNPHTHKAVSVDAHGVVLDTDGDGIPDYKDKELLTLQKCFPVDSNGIGDCPDPSCCKEPDRGSIDPLPICKIGLIEIQFSFKSRVLTDSATFVLNALANELKSNPYCKLRIGAAGSRSKNSIQLSWDRVKAVIHYFVEKQGISEERFLFGFDIEEDINKVGLIGTIDEVPNSIPVPHLHTKTRRK